MSEESHAIEIASRWLDFKMNSLVQMVPGDPDCDACVLARQFIRLKDERDRLRDTCADHVLTIARTEADLAAANSALKALTGLSGKDATQKVLAALTPSPAPAADNQG